MIGKDVKMLRLLHNIKTQQQCAQILGVTERTIASIETSTKPVSKRIMCELRANFNVDTYEKIKKQFSDLSFA